MMVRTLGLIITIGSCAALMLPQVATAESGVAGHQTNVKPSGQTTSRPAVATDGAHATSATAANIEGNADPEGQLTTLHAGYALATARWCTSHGAKGKPATTRPRTLGSSRAMFSEIVVKVTGLTPASEYCAELVAKNPSGTSHGGQVRFVTLTTTAQGAVRHTARTTPTRPPSSGSNNWPTAARVTVALLAAVVLMLGAILVRARLKLGARRRSSTKPAAG